MGMDKPQVGLAGRESDSEDSSLGSWVKGNESLKARKRPEVGLWVNTCLLDVRM